MAVSNTITAKILCEFEPSAEAMKSGDDITALFGCTAGHIADDVIHVTDAERARWDSLSNPNLLINPDFAVNQQGAASYVGTGALAVDRWRIFKDGSLTVADGGVVLSLKAGATQGGAVYQKNSELIPLVGKVITLSVSVDGTMYSAQITVPASGKSAQVLQTPCGEWYLYHLSETVIQVACDVTENTSVVNWVKVETGGVATPFIPPEPTLELLKCQRYYQIRSTNDIEAVDMRPSMNAITDIKPREDGNYGYIAEL